MSDDEEVPISHLQRRRIEGRVLIPFIEAMREKLGETAATEIVEATIRKLAVADGARWAETYGSGMAALQRVAEEVWAGGGSLEVEFLGQSDEHLDFNVTRCKYAEFFKDLGLAGTGFQVHCNRDHAMVDGFNPDIELTRSQTLMQGALCCDFRFRRKR